MLAPTLFYSVIAFLPSREVAVSFGGFSIRWYGLAYVAAFVLAWRLLPRLARRRQLVLTSADWLTVITWGAAGALLGGRLGYALLYEPSFFLEQPWQLLVLSGGGMSAHGGFLGAGLALWLAARQQRLSFYSLLDIVVVPAGLGIGLGRLANFINQELYTTPLGFAAGAAEGLVPAGLAWWLLVRGTAAGKPATAGMPAGVFLVGYSVLRFATEFVRVQPFGYFAGLTLGQWYSLPLLAAGAWRLLRSVKPVNAVN